MKNRRDGRTYCKVDLAALCDFFGQNMDKLEDACDAIGVVAEGGDDELQNILPLEHLDGEVCEADT